MRPRTFSLFLLLYLSLLSLGAQAQGVGDNIFGGTKVHTIRLTFQQPNYWDTLSYYYNRGDEQYILARAEVNGTLMDSVGVRFKGNSSFTYPGVKKSFKIAFDEYKSFKWDGVKAVHLNNSWGDPTMMREKVILDFCRDNGVHAPRANYVQLFINDSLWGLYSLIENVDKTFLKARLGTSDGNLFKAVDDFRAVPPGEEILSDFRWFGTAESLYTKRYELKTDGSTTAWPQLLALLDDIHNAANPVEAMQETAYIETLYKAFATDLLFGNLDSYCGSGRNFYFYFTKATGKVSWIMWDVGLGLGVYPSGVARTENISMLFRSNDTLRPLATRLFDTPALRAAYLNQVCQFANGPFHPTALAAHIDSIATVIRPFVYADPHCMYTPLQFETNIQTDITADGGGSTKKPGLKSFISARATSVQSQLATLGITCTTGLDDPTASPASFLLATSYPNPFSSSTTIDFTLDFPAQVQLDIWSPLGSHVHTLLASSLGAGRHSVSVPASDLKEGVYFYRLVANNHTLVGTLVKLPR